MRRQQQPFAYILFGAILGGFVVFQLNQQNVRLFTSNQGTKAVLRANRSELLEHPEIHRHEHDDGSQEQLFAFQHEHG